MPHVLTVTFNPALDKTYLMRRLDCGRVNRVERVIARAGGKGINVSRILKVLGCDVTATGFLGGLTGALVERDLSAAGIMPDFVHVAGETRTCVAISHGAESPTEINEPGPEIGRSAWAEFLAKVEILSERVAWVVVSGSLPPGMEPGDAATLVERIRSRGKRVMVDVSGPALRACLSSRPTGMKPNEDEIHELLGLRCSDAADLAKVALDLGARGVEIVAISMGERGAVFAHGGEVVWAGGQPERVENPVGSGDALVAGLVAGLAQGYCWLDAIRLSIASALAKVAETDPRAVGRPAILAALSRVKVERQGAVQDTRPEARIED